MNCEFPPLETMVRRSGATPINVSNNESDGNLNTRGVKSSLTANTSAIERQMLDGKLVLVGYDGLPLNPIRMNHQLFVMKKILVIVNSRSHTMVWEGLRTGVGQFLMPNF